MHPNSFKWAFVLAGLLLCIWLVHPASLYAANANKTIPGGIITTPELWSLEDSPIQVQGDLDVQAALTIEPGVTVNFSAGAILNILDSLTAFGTPAAPILFTSAGGWGGIRTGPLATILLSHCEVSRASVGILVATQDIVMDSCILRQNGTGMSFTGAGGQGQDLLNLEINGNQGYALEYWSGSAVQSEFAPQPEFVNLTVTGNGVDAVSIHEAIQDAQCTGDEGHCVIRLHPVRTGSGDVLPFDLPDDFVLTPPFALELLAGSMLRATSLTVQNGSSLSAVGLVLDPIAFTSSKVASWQGITLEPGAQADIAFCEVERTQNSGITVQSRNVSITDCTIHNGFGNGLTLSEVGIDPILQRLKIEDNQDHAVYQTTPDMGPRYDELYFANNGTDAIVIAAGTISNNVSLQSQVGIDGAQVAVEAMGLDVGSGVTLTIEAGSTITAAKMSAGSQGTLVTDAGATIVVGTVEARENATLSFDAGVNLTADRWHVDMDGVLAFGEHTTLSVDLVTVAGGTLSIQPGATLAAQAKDSQIKVLDQGSLIADGVVFTRTTTLAEPWRGILFEAGSMGQLTNCEISGAGIDFVQSGALEIRSSDVTVDGCHIHDSLGNGIVLRGDGIAPQLTNLRLTHNAHIAVLQMDGNMDPLYHDLFVSANGKDSIYLSNSRLIQEQDVVLEPPGATDSGLLAYDVPELYVVGVTATLTLENGAILRFVDPRDSFGRMSVQGRLVADGATLTGREETPGIWTGISLEPGASAVLRNCHILYAGWNGDGRPSTQRTALRIDSTEPVSVHGCTIRDSQTTAITTRFGARPDLRWNNIYDNLWGVQQVGGLNASGIDSVAAGVDARFIWWGDASGPFHSVDNPNGQGNGISGARYAPWATEPITSVPDLLPLYLPSLRK